MWKPVAALAALRRTPAHLAEIDYALRHIERRSPPVDGVEEDARLHLAIAAAAGNPSLGEARGKCLPSRFDRRSW